MRRCLILYASQTGYCIETADRIKREARQRHFQVEMMSMDQYQLSKLPSESLIAFVCSVTGQGIEPDSMKIFWKFLLRKDLPTDSLKKLSFGVFGQGDSSYAKFNFPAKKLHKRLLQLGASALVHRGDGDDQHYLGVDGALDPWLTEWWKAVLSIYPIPSGLEIISSNSLPLNTFELALLDEKVSDHYHQNSYSKLGDFDAEVLVNNRITNASHFQDVRHFEFNIFEKSEKIMQMDKIYEAGDILIVYPGNPSDKVQNVLDFLGWNDVADKFYQFSVNDPFKDVSLPPFLTEPITLRQLLECHLNIFGRPRRYFFELLSFFALDRQHAEKLREFASVEGQYDLNSYSHKLKRTMFEVLQDFSSVKIPIKYLLDLIPVMLPRSFSIASAPSVHSSIHLAVAIVEYKTKLAEMRVGVCTNWMSKLNPGDKIQVSMKKGTMRLPENIDTPIICIGPGTGVAPMRSLLFDRNHCSKGKSKCVLLFGCRSKCNDFYYSSDWEGLSNMCVWPAFSRDQPEKVYVQHKMIEHGAELWNLIHEEGAFIYLSGNAKRMPIDVEDALIRIFKEQGGLDSNDATSYLSFLKRVGRFQEECWS